MKKTSSRLPMPAGLRIEHAKAAGIDNEPLFRALKEKDRIALQPAGEDLDWDYMFSYTEDHEEDVKEAIHHGYEFKFLTINGLRNYLKLRFSLQEDHDFEVSNEGVVTLNMNAADVKVLESVLPGHWILSAVYDSEGKQDQKFQIKPSVIEENKTAGR